MINITSAAIFFLAAGIFTSVTILSAYQVLFAVPLVYYTFLAFKHKTLRLPKSAYWLLGFTAVALLSLFLNLDIIPKPSKNFGRVKYFMFGVFGIIVLRDWIAKSNIKTKRIITYTFFVSVIAAGSFAIWQWATLDLSINRVNGLTETMRYGYGSGMVLLTVLSAILHKEKISGWFDYRIAVIAFIIGFTGMYATYTRGALLGFLCGLPFVIYFYKPKIGLILGAVAIIFVIGTGSLYLLESRQDGTKRSMFNKNNKSDVMRRSMWKAAIIAIQEKPVLGWGLSNFHTQVRRIKYAHDLDEKSYDDAHSHNLFLEVASGTGLIGLLFFLGWLFSWAWEIWHSGGIVRFLVFPFGVSFILASQFEVTFDANNASMIFFIYALSMAVNPGNHVKQV